MGGVGSGGVCVGDGTGMGVVVRGGSVDFTDGGGSGVDGESDTVGEVGIVGDGRVGVDVGKGMDGVVLLVGFMDGVVLLVGLLGDGTPTKKINITNTNAANAPVPLILVLFRGILASNPRLPANR